MLECPSYPHKAIRSVESLAKALHVTPGLLENVAERAPKLYIGPKKKLKRDNVTYRDVWDTKVPLKGLLRTINDVILKQVSYPQYLQGSLSGRDFVSNVEVHQDASVLITEDVRKFFDHITSDHVYRVWSEFFGFGDGPASLLTRLTTNASKVFQGTPTSSYLANLALWKVEPTVVAKLRERGIQYSRYVDDVSLSSRTGLAAEEKTWAIAQVYAMFGSCGFRPARDKHRIQSARTPKGAPLQLMGLTIVNGRVSLSRPERGTIESMVHKVEARFDRSETGGDFLELFNQASGKVGRLKRKHPAHAEGLRARLNAMRAVSHIARTEIEVSKGPPASADGANDEQPF
jgi:hypothetical protein